MPQNWGRTHRHAAALQPVESLEARRLFSGASLAHRLLTIVGPRQDAEISLAMISARTLHVTVNSRASDFRIKGIGAIQILCGRGNDTIRANDESVTRIGKPMTIDLGGGNDSADTDFADCTVFGGDGNDTITSHDGGDELHGGAGNDKLDSRYGGDTLWGDLGDDFIIAGPDDDLVSGGPGNDYIEDGWGKDTVSGNRGADSFIWRDYTGDTWVDRQPGEAFNQDYRTMPFEGGGTMVLNPPSTWWLPASNVLGTTSGLDTVTAGSSTA